nr:unnamed protein product [uncultured bacterium]
MARRDKKKARNIPAPGPRSHWERHILPHVDPVKISLEQTRPRPPRPRPDLKPVEDLRHDYQDQTFRTVSGRPARKETRPQGEVPRARLHTPLHTYFRDPHRVLVCIRRDARRRVLFALRRIGKGRRVSPFHRFTEKSYIRCK